VGAIKDGFESTFRPFVTDGVPASGANKPSKAEASALGTVIEVQVAAAAAAVSGDGIEAIVAAVQPLVDDATEARDQVVAAVATVVPIGTATVASNDATATVYNVTLPSGVNFSANGQKFGFYVPSTALGAVVRLNVNGVDTRDVFFVVDRQLREGWLAGFSTNNGGVKWNFESQLPNDIVMASTETSAAAAYASMGLIAGAQPARPIRNNPNNILVASAPIADSVKFKAYISETPAAGALFITDQQSGDRRELTAAGNAFDASVLVAPIILEAQYSGGFGKFTVVSGTPVPTLPELETLASAASPDLWAVLASIVDEPYGTVTKGGDNKPVFTPKTIHILGRGSSVSTAADNAQGQPGRNGGCPRDHVPLWLLRDGIEDKFGPGINVVDWNYSHGGHVASQAGSQYDDAIEAGMPAVPDIIFDCFGMNDLAPASYNSGQVSPTYMLPDGGYYNEIKGKLDLGVKLVIIATTPHENTDKYEYVMPGGVPMIWPYNLSANVSPDQLVPPAALSKLERDWTGSGVRRVGGARAAHVNTMQREMVRRFNADPVYRGRVVLCDAGWAWFRYGLEKHTLTELYGPQEVVHPIELGHEVSYDRCIREIVDAMQRGQSDKWWFRGEDAGE
jgi:hypothetical protein